MTYEYAAALAIYSDMQNVFAMRRSSVFSPDSATNFPQPNR